MHRVVLSSVHLRSLREFTISSLGKRSTINVLERHGVNAGSAN